MIEALPNLTLTEAKELMLILEKKYKFGLSMKEVDKDIKKISGDLKPLTKHQEMLESKKMADAMAEDMSYIG